ncbi:SRA stem-loop-interacting RNA-binding protein-like protein [Leptotrombidium deliense]|uniref:SRA stem-loop-interacting RNA-binding protein-like protein n=1 Tax=Leptotrombidium deliense TaxID=299467 RepID=A0A443RZX9_9ACAR|nr:SRA stem-loop-interacting RNA-binding protein-like protein [Leptotrombidium deliense]
MAPLNRFVLMVRNLPWTVGKCEFSFIPMFDYNLELRQHFEEFGKILNVNIPYDTSKGLHNGYGFVTFSSQNSLDTAIEAKHTLQGHNKRQKPKTRSKTMIASENFQWQKIRKRHLEELLVYTDYIKNKSVDKNEKV